MKLLGQKYHKINNVETYFTARMIVHYENYVGGFYLYLKYPMKSFSSIINLNPIGVCFQLMFFFKFACSNKLN